MVEAGSFRQAGLVLGETVSPIKPKDRLRLLEDRPLRGEASGIFTGMSAPDRLELDKRINQQRQAQVELQDKNASYAPRINFGRGLITLKPA